VREFCADEKTRKAQNRYRIRALALFNRAKQKKAKRCQVRNEKKKRCRNVFENDDRDFRDGEKSERRDQMTMRFSRSEDNRCGVCSVAREAFVSHVSPVP
jgi:hypothetical protein